VAVSRFYEPVEEEVSNLRHAGAPGVTVSLTRPSLTISKIFDPTERSSVPSSAASILDQ
jgi:hypothetical protein